MLVTAILIVTVATLGAVSTSDGTCKLNLQTQINPHNEPLIFEASNNEEKLVNPQVEIIKGKKQGIIQVKEGDKLLIACLGKNNAVKASKKKTGLAECSNGRLSINRKPANEKNLSCIKGAANSWIEKTTKECGKDDHIGTIFQLGFMLTDDDEKSEKFFPLVEVCHNIDKMVTYYTHHQLYGASLEGAIKSSERKSFSAGPKKLGLYAGINAEEAYSQAGQKISLDDILGPGASKRYTDKKTFLARGHLSPDADFIYHTGQLMTYYHINAAPQWQTFNGHSWLAVENAVRKLATMEGITLKVWTGTYGVLKLKDNDENEKEIYLDPKESSKPKTLEKANKGPGKHRKARKPGKPKKSGKPKAPGKPKKSPPPKKSGSSEESDESDGSDESKESNESKESEKSGDSHLPVPEVYWKLVQHPSKQLCTVAVGHNNVFLEEPPTPICNPETVGGWPSLTTLNGGYVYYCNYDSFKKAVSYVPDVECKGLFEFPE